MLSRSTIFSPALRQFSRTVIGLWVWLASAAHAETVNVTVSNFQFSPATINIKAGDTVQWTWQDGGHSVTSGSACAPDGNFNTGVQAAGFSFSRIFTEAGQVPFFCTPHCARGMAGTVNVTAAATTGTSGKKVPKKLMLQFNTMYGVNGPQLGDQNTLRGISGDALPWTVKKATGQLYTNGLLVIKVRGLTFPDNSLVPADKRSKNDEASFRGLVSCMTEEAGQAVTRNVVTDAFSATSSGNATIHAKLALPNPCIAPIVMVVAGSGDQWLAATGFEAP